MAHLFVWRDEICVGADEYGYYSCLYCNVPIKTYDIEHFPEGSPLRSPERFLSDMCPRGYRGYCDYCRDDRASAKPIYHTKELQICPLCGWRDFLFMCEDRDENTGEEVLYKQYVTQAIIKKFDISDTAVALEELGTHLRSSYSDIYSLSPGRFEELVCDIFKHCGEVASLTKATKDEGIDIYLFKPNEGSWCIIECKRYNISRKVGIQAIDRLYGVQLALNIKEAKLVTTSTFSKFAKQRIAKSKAGEYGFKMKMIDADELLKLLGVYNSKLPPLSRLTQKDVEEIIRINKENIIEK